MTRLDFSFIAPEDARIIARMYGSNTNLTPRQTLRINFLERYLLKTIRCISRIIWLATSKKNGHNDGRSGGIKGWHGDWRMPE